MLCSISRQKQLAFKWYKQVCTVMSDLGFVCTESDHMLFYYDGEDDLTTSCTAFSTTRVKCLIGWHIDDGMGVSNSRPFLKRVKKRITETFDIKDLGPVSKYLGVQFKQDRKTRQLWMHQGEYTTFLPQEYGLPDCNPICLPADPKAPFRDPTCLLPRSHKPPFVLP